MAGTADFIFLIDGTGSMNPCMQALKDNIHVFLDEIGGEQSPVYDWRGKVVVYRDQEVDGSHWLEDNPFVADAAALKSQIDSLEAKGGGDEPESALDAIHLLATYPQAARSAQDVGPQEWRYRSNAALVVIVFTDATFKPIMTYDAGAGGTVEDVRNAVMNNKLILIIYAPDEEGWESLSQVDKAEWIAIDKAPDERGEASFVEGLRQLVGDQDNFKKAMIALAESVSKSAEVEVL